jgi:hypothetical protein
LSRYWARRRGYSQKGVAACEGHMNEQQIAEQELVSIADSQRHHERFMRLIETLSGECVEQYGSLLWKATRERELAVN